MSGSKLTPSGRGLSPQVRGNLIEAPGVQRQLGSIPAGAGEPRLCPRPRRRRRVYPRRCGGTGSVGASSGTVAGLSPQVRGNPLIHCSVSWAAGSIPAGAGEPASRTGSPCRSWVYPRRCGGTDPTGWVRHWYLGLSPQVRGNRERDIRSVDELGSIPAGAGEPAPSAAALPAARVYPRRCGGTLLGLLGCVARPGLSPQVRGNLHALGSSNAIVRSIPAGAGEPTRVARWTVGVWVYPRRCGGTRRFSRNLTISSGLSPQVRGNHDPGRQTRDGDGSIPAGAGEPHGVARPLRPASVYPRRCGGTLKTEPHHWRMSGLSPQVRGNRLDRLRLPALQGSIPAGAGEPLAILADSPGRVEALPRPLEAAAWCFVSDVKERASPRVHDLLTSRTPSASQMFFGGSPR